MTIDFDLLPPGILPGGRYDQWNGAPPRYIACDVDGTLIGTDAAATRRVARTVATVREAGIRVGLATGRTRLGADAIRSQLRIEGPNVFHDGAEIHDGIRTLDAWRLTIHQVDALLTLVHGRPNAYLEIYTSDELFVSASDERAMPHWEMLGMWPTAVLSDAAPLAAATILKGTIVLFDGSTALRQDLVDVVEATGLRVGPSRSPRTPTLDYLNITHPGTDKGRGVLRAAAAIGVAEDAVMAVGDAENDLPLLQVAGTAVAMGQASAVVREAAHLVVPSVDDDGVVDALGLALARPWAREAAQAGAGDADPGRPAPHGRAS